MSGDLNINYDSQNEDEMFSYDIENNVNEPINKNEPNELFIDEFKQHFRFELLYFYTLKF